jgi:hypothetical protein
MPKVRQRGELFSAVAAATKNENDGENDYPCTVIVKEMA